MPKIRAQLELDAEFLASYVFENMHGSARFTVKLAAPLWESFINSFYKIFLLIK